MRHVSKRPSLISLGHGIDFIGDVHGCSGEFMELIDRLGYVYHEKDKLYRHPHGRKIVSLGDITSRGPHSIAMLDFFIRHIKAGLAEMTDSNHGWKIARWLDGRKVTLAHGDEKVAEEFEQYQQEHGLDKALVFREQSRQLLLGAPSHIRVQQNGKTKVVAVHAGIRDSDIGKDTTSVQNFVRYGDVGGTAPDGRPIRRDWTEGRKSDVIIVWGHDPRPEPERRNNAINIDQGCVFGGHLTAYRYPEDELVSVAAKENYSGLSDTPLTRYMESYTNRS